MECYRVHDITWNFTFALLAQAYGFLEFFCGQAWVSTVMRASGVSTAQFDISLGNPKQGKQDAMDLLTPSGFSFLASKLYHLKHFYVAVSIWFEWVNN